MKKKSVFKKKKKKKKKKREKKRKKSLLDSLGVLTRSPHPPKVTKIENESFQAHHTLQS